MKVGTSPAAVNRPPYYLLVTWVGIGMDKAAKIAFRTLTVYLTASFTYTNARTWSIQAATDLYGAVSNEVAQVKNAWCAVNVVCGNQPPTVTLTSPTSNTS